MMNRSHFLASGLLLASFVAGGAVGGATWKRHDCGGSQRQGFLEHLQDNLDLTPTQRASVSGILERHRPAMHAVWAEVRPRFEQVRSEIRSEIKGVLSARQQSRYQVLMAHDDSIRAARDSGGARAR